MSWDNMVKHDLLEKIKELDISVDLLQAELRFTQERMQNMVDFFVAQSVTDKNIEQFINKEPPDAIYSD